MSDSQAFAAIANVAFASPTRVLCSSWCPDKDLLALVVRVANKDRLSLWKMQGSKIWEVEVDAEATDGATSAETSIIDIAWSPENLHIAVAHDPPLLTLHSIQDGREERRLSVPSPENSIERVWWLKEPRAEKKPTIPDVFKRQNIITGSAHSILKTQPLLDALPDDFEQLSAADLFAFQSARKTSRTSSLPASISSWPTLPPDLLLASIQPHSTTASTGKRPGEELDEADDSNINSVLFVSTVSKGDARPRLYAWLDGSYPLGEVEFPYPVDGAVELCRLEGGTYLVQTKCTLLSGRPAETAITPARLHLNLLPRDVARNASSTRALVWYAMRLINEMHDTWWGESTHSGAWGVGPEWIKALEQKQAVAFGVERPSALLDLTVLLAGGRASESLIDYLTSGDQMTERGLQKWESTVSDALYKLRDYASRRVAPAFQRIHILLQEVQGWAQLPQYTHCRFDLTEINAALEQAAQGIMCANWLAAVARTEVRQFKEFITWIKYESQRAANQSNESYTAPPPKHDILDVNAYLESGLVVSQVTRWFMGPAPRFPLIPGFGIDPDENSIRKEDLESDDGSITMDEASVTDKKFKLNEALKQARGKLSQGKKAFPWPPPNLALPVADHLDVPADIKPYNFSTVPRNIHALIENLATRCNAIFKEASGAVARTASFAGLPAPTTTSLQLTDKLAWAKERCIISGAAMEQHFVMNILPKEQEKNQLLVLVKARHQIGADGVEISYVAFDSTVIPQQHSDEISESTPVNILDAEFFDDELLILVYRTRDGNALQTCIATLRYADLEYQAEAWDKDITTRERLADIIAQKMSAGTIVPISIPIHQARALVGCGDGPLTLSVNGRAGRRVACVLGEEGMALEVLDMEGDEGEEEDIIEE